MLGSFLLGVATAVAVLVGALYALIAAVSRAFEEERKRIVRDAATANAEVERERYASLPTLPGIPQRSAAVQREVRALHVCPFHNTVSMTNRRFLFTHVLWTTTGLGRGGDGICVDPVHAPVRCLVKALEVRVTSKSRRNTWCDSSSGSGSGDDNNDDDDKWSEQ